MFRSPFFSDGEMAEIAHQISNREAPLLWSNASGLRLRLLQGRGGPKAGVGFARARRNTRSAQHSLNRGAPLLAACPDAIGGRG